MAKDAEELDDAQPEGRPQTLDPDRACAVCGVRLSMYNPGPHCWQHTMGWPWRGPSAKPRF